MQNLFESKSGKLRPPIFWFLLALVLRVPVYLLILYGNHFYDLQNGLLGTMSGDAFSYILSVENFINHGTYAYDLQSLNSYAGRMPGYGIIYLLPRLFFDAGTSLNFVVCFQILLSVAGIYFLSRSAELLFENRKSFYLTFFIAILSSYICIWDFVIIPESAAVNLLIISFYFFARFMKNKNPAQLLLSGAFISWAIFMKSYLLPVLLIYSVGLILWMRKNRSLPATKKIVLFIFLWMPFLLPDGMWVIRNWSYYKKIVPLQINTTAGYQYSTTDLKLRDFLKSWGGDVVSWNPKAEIRWFDKYAGRHDSQKGNAELFDETVSLPAYLQTSAFNIDTLKNFRTRLLAVTYQNGNETQVSGIDSTLDHYTMFFISEHPFIHHVIAPLRLLKCFLLHSGTYNLFSKSYNELPLLLKIIKLFYSGFYLIILFFGAAGLVWNAITNRNVLLLMTVLVVTYLTFVFPLLFRLIEYRYFVSAYPFFLVFAVNMFLKLYPNRN